MQPEDERAGGAATIKEEYKKLHEKEMKIASLGHGRWMCPAVQ